MTRDTELTIRGFAPRSLPTTPRPASDFIVPRPRITETEEDSIDMLALLLGEIELPEAD